jgi:hypothetical protein
VQQSNVIFGALLIAFIVFITLRGELPTYLTILRGGGATATSTSSAATPSASTSILPTPLASSPFNYVQGSEGISIPSIPASQLSPQN